MHLGVIEDYKVMTESEQAENPETGETSVGSLAADQEAPDGNVTVEADVSKGAVQEQHEGAGVGSASMQIHEAEHRYSRDELLSFGDHEDLKQPPKDLEASGIYRELLGTLFCVRSVPDGPAPDEVRLRPGGSLPVRDQEAPRPIPNGPPGVPRDGNPSSWKEQDNSWRSPFKGSPSGSQPIRSRLVDDSPPVISPPGGPPGLNMRRAAMEGPPGSGEWHPGSEGWRRAGGPPQEWRGPPGAMGEEDEAQSPRRHGSARVSQDMERWGGSKVPGRNESAWRPNAQPGRGGVGRGSEWSARRGRVVPPPGPGKGTPPPGFDGPPGFPTKPVAKEPRATGGPGPEQLRNGKAVGDGKPRGLEGDWRAAKEKTAGDQDAPEGESQAERMRREFEEERQRLQDQRKKGGHTAQRAANETMGDILGDDELEEMRLRDNEEAAQTDSHIGDASAKSGTAPEEDKQQQSKLLQPPPGFSANHLFGDVDDDDPLDLITNLSFLNDTKEEEKPPLAKEKSSRFANFFQSETSVPGMAAGPAAGLGNAASGTPAAGPAPYQSPFPPQLGGQALLQQLQAAQQQQGSQGLGGQHDLLAKLAQAAAAHPHLQRAVPSTNARTLDDVEAAVRGGGPPGSLLGTFQQGPQGAQPGNALLSLLQGNTGAPKAPFGQDGGMPPRGEAFAQASGRPDGPPQPALDPLLAHFSAMGMAQNARQNTQVPQQQQQNQLGQGLGPFGGAGANAGQQNTLASLLAGAYSQSPGHSAGMGNTGVPLHLLQQQEQLLRARASLPGQASVQMPGAMPMAQNLPQNFPGLQQQSQQPNLGHLNQFMPQQQPRPQALNEHQQNILRLLQQQQQRQQQQQALQLQQQLQQQQRLAQLQAQAQQQRMTPLQALQMQLQLQQQLAGQQNYSNNSSGLERFFQLNAGQRAAVVPAQGGARPTHEDLEQRRFNAPH